MERSKKCNNLFNKTWKRCKSFGRGLKKSSDSPAALTRKSRSWPRMAAEEGYAQIRKGCFSVYVGPEKQRFVVKTECANHPLFKALLDEAESEFGYETRGPITLPCHVEIFYRVLSEMEDSGAGDGTVRTGCRLSRRYHLLSPSRMVAINQF